MLIERPGKIVSLQFMSVEELLTARRVMEATYHPFCTVEAVARLATQSVNNDWQVLPHSFERNECVLIFEALRRRSQDNSPGSHHDNYEIAHADQMVAPHLDLMATVYRIPQFA